MKRFARIFTLAAVLIAFALPAAGQDEGYDVFVPISKYIRQGDAVKLSAWFADNLEVSILSGTNNASRNQARQILKAFFDNYTPRSFALSHKASRGNTKYALGTLNAGGEVFLVTIFVNCKVDTYQIQLIKIERQTIF